MSAYGALAQGTLQVVVPNNLANVEGNSSTSDPFTSSSFRLQMVFDASQFALPSGPGISNGVANIGFRIDETSINSAIFAFGGASIQLSTTQRTPDSLSPVFADNIGPDVTTIFTGATSFGTLYQPGVEPQPFDGAFPATTPFFYDPSRGNLLLDIIAGSGQVLFPGTLDAQLASGDSISRVFANAAGASTGTADTLGLVTRFTFVTIPEPTPLLLLVGGLATVMIFRRK